MKLLAEIFQNLNDSDDFLSAKQVLEKMAENQGSHSLDNQSEFITHEMLYI